MAKQYIIMDTADLLLTRKSDNKKVLSTTTTLASIEQAVTEDRLKAGIGSVDVAVISSNKEITVNVTEALWSLDYLEMTQGVKIKEDGKITVTKRGKATIADNAGTLEATIDDAPVGLTEAFMIDENNENHEVTVTTGTFTVPTPTTLEDGDEVTVLYEEEVTGETLDFEVGKYSETYKCQLSTIAYDADTMEVVKDIYITFDNVKPSSNFTLGFEMGTPITPELSLMVLKNKNSDKLGTIALVDRV